MRKLLSLTVVGASAVTLVAAVSAARGAEPTRQVPVPWQIVTEERAIGEGCGVVAFLQISEVRGAVSYTATVVDSVTTTYTFSGPPFPGDVTDIGGTLVRAPKGAHRWGLSSSGSSSGGGTGCAQAKAGFLAPSRWKVKSATATVAGKPEEEKQGIVAGRVVETVCEGNACSEEGLKGVVVSALGKGGGSATTGAGGRYSIEVEPGSFTVKPSLAGREFEPPSRQVSVAEGATATANFSTCAIVRTPQSRRRSLATCEPLRIDWTMPDHIRAPGWDDTIPSSTYVNPRGGWTVNLFLKNKAGAPLACRPGHTYTWRVSPRGTKQVMRYEKRPCKLTVQVPREGIFSVTVEERNAKTGTVAASGAKDVTVQDFLIAGVGDSNGSGQANPPYWNRQCDRSAESYQMRAAEAVERDDPRTSVTFVHLACSGARTVHLTDRLYVGQEADPNNLLPPQLVALRTAMRPGRPVREIDAIIMSAGINDVRFGGIVGTCVENAAKAHAAGNCPDIPVVRTLDKVGEPTFARAAAGASGAKTLREMVAEETAALPQRYADLAARIATRVTVKPERILITAYPDEAWRTQTELCDERGGNFPGLKRPEWEWLYEAGVGLATAIAGTASLGWTPVMTIPAKFRGHGYCTGAGANWFRSFPRSVVNQGNEFGTFHATRNGHIAMGIEVFGVLCQQLFKNGTTACGGEAREPQPGSLP